MHDKAARFPTCATGAKNAEHRLAAWLHAALYACRSDGRVEAGDAVQHRPLPHTGCERYSVAHFLEAEGDCVRLVPAVMLLWSRVAAF